MFRGVGGAGGQGRQNVPGRPPGAQDGHQGDQDSVSEFASV